MDFQLQSMLEQSDAKHKLTRQATDETLASSCVGGDTCGDAQSLSDTEAPALTAQLPTPKPAAGGSIGGNKGRPSMIRVPSSTPVSVAPPAAVTSGAPVVAGTDADLLTSEFLMTPTFVAGLDALANNPVWLPSPSAVGTPVQAQQVPLPLPPSALPGVTPTVPTLPTPTMDGTPFAQMVAAAAAACAPMPAPTHVPAAEPAAHSPDTTAAAAATLQLLQCGPTQKVQPVHVPRSMRAPSRRRRRSQRAGRGLKRLQSSEACTAGLAGGHTAPTTTTTTTTAAVWFGQPRTDKRVAPAGGSVASEATVATAATAASDEDSTATVGGCGAAAAVGGSGVAGAGAGSTSGSGVAGAGAGSSSRARGGRRQKPQYRGVSFVTRRKQWQAQVTVSDKVHLGNFATEEAAAHAVTFAKTTLRDKGFTVKLQDNEEEPVLDTQARAATEAQVGRVVTNFASKWQTQLQHLSAAVSAPKRMRGATTTDAGVSGGGGAVAAAPCDVPSQNVTVLATSRLPGLRSHAFSVADQLAAANHRVVVANREHADGATAPATSWFATRVGGDCDQSAALDAVGLVSLLRESDVVVPVLHPKDGHFKDLLRGLSSIERE